MHLFVDPSAIAGFFTLMFLEIILGIDNIIFISILSKKLPHNQRNKARYTGLILALFMRFGLLIITSFLVNLKNPIFINKFFVFSIKEIILLIGGIFLFIKTIFELFNYVNIIVKKNKKNIRKSSFWCIVTEIVILDAILSIDSVMTAIGMIQNLSIIISAVIISTIFMIFLSNLFIKFINSQKKIIVLCLCLLLIISLNLIIESLGFYIPKEYLYISIGFYLFVETINQIRKRNKIKQKQKEPLRKKIYNIIYRIINNKKENQINKKKDLFLIEKEDKIYNYINNKNNINKIENQEIKILINILKFNNNKIQNIIIPQEKIIWINITENYESIKNKLLHISHNMILICENELNEIIGVVPKKKLLRIIKNNEDIYNFSIKYPPFIIPDTINTINLLHLLRYCKNNCIIVSNESGIVIGLIKPKDIFNIIVGKFLDKKNTPKVIINDKNWIVTGSMNLNNLKKILNITTLNNSSNCISIADFLIKNNKNIPKTGTTIYSKPYYFYIIKSNLYKIHLIKITQDKKNNFH
ncbi:UPF0053 inner membrane protein YoaE [Buchnera aphidicola (Cinara piceae)]|uniref:UPF0053 inner membrane protein YoaE n=1 Tax=Buchnera aphidicola (Cinara piceae) TaxID=1660043 RepID=A0A803FTZ0_9GAMM|nr:transporter associated domain-containing protein [Buchnera aphidicola]VFP88356.1 UPF0053 inner membrane protein YoaE [Buchnera aphidicola (Cinara piceae)]